jgi:hypothetical protein
MKIEYGVEVGRGARGWCFSFRSSAMREQEALEATGDIASEGRGSVAMASLAKTEISVKRRCDDFVRGQALLRSLLKSCIAEFSGVSSEEI